MGGGAMKFKLIIDKEKDEEIELYSYIDEKGNFLVPFGQTK